MPPFQTARISSGWLEVVARLVEQHLAEPTADDDAEHAVEQQVVERCRRDAMPGLAGGAAPAEQQEGDEAGQVHQPVPAHGQAGRR